MKQEIEVKYKVDSSETELMDFVNSQGIVFTSVEDQRDVYWDNNSYKIINLKRGVKGKIC